MRYKNALQGTLKPVLGLFFSMSDRSIVWRYYAFRASNAYGFYLPFSIIYLQQERGFGLATIGLLQATFLAAMVVGGVPTGYVADRLGRRASLAVGNTCVVAALLAWTVACSPLTFAGLYALWAIGWTFQSGTRDAWLYELLDRRFDESEYARVSGRGSTVQLVVSAASAIAAGGLYAVDTTLPFLANVVLVAAGLPLLATLPAVGASDDTPFRAGDALTVLWRQVKRPELRWLVAYAALFNALFSLTRWLEQPAMDAVGVPVVGFGLVYAGFKLFSAGAAATTGWFEERLGTRWVFALVAPIYGLTYATVGFSPALIVPVLFLNRGLTTILRPIRNQYLNDRLADVGRAKVLSGASMALSVASAAGNVIGGQLADIVGPTTLLPAASVVVAVVGSLLWLATDPIRGHTGTAQTTPVEAGD